MGNLNSKKYDVNHNGETTNQGHCGCCLSRCCRKTPSAEIRKQSASIKRTGSRTSLASIRSGVADWLTSKKGFERLPDDDMLMSIINSDPDPWQHTNARSDHMTKPIREQPRKGNRERNSGNYNNLYEDSKRHLIVSLHIGRSTSGFAYSSQDSTSIFLNEKWINEFGTSNIKTPTAVLIEATRSSSWKFGCEAIDAFKEASDLEMLCLLDQIQSDHYRENGKNCPELTSRLLLEFIFRKLSDKLEIQLKKNNLWTGLGANNIKWIVIHNPHDDTFHRSQILDIVREIGQTRNILPISADDAAARWCLNFPLFAFRKDGDNTLPIGQTFCIIDMDGGYISLFERNGIDSERNIFSSSFQTNLDDAYETWFVNEYQKERIEVYKSTYPRDWFTMLEELKIRLQGFKYGWNKDHFLILPKTFIKEMLLNNDTFAISYLWVRDMLEKCAHVILGCLKKNTSKIDYTFLIGRTSMLEEALRQMDNTQYNIGIGMVKTPPESDAWALKGALLINKL